MKNHLISESDTIKDALVILNGLGLEVLNLFVIDKSGKLVGSLTDGDIRRALLAGRQLTDPITVAMKVDFEKLQENNISYEDLKRLRRKNIRLVPLISSKGEFIELIDLTRIKSLLPIDALIMAGGE